MSCQYSHIAYVDTLMVNKRKLLFALFIFYETIESLFRKN